MGYSTRYELHWTETPACKGVDVAAVVAQYIEARGDDIGYALEPDGTTSESCKWYEHEADMRIMSRAIQGVVFHLTGEGESAGDIWDLFALDGEVQKHPAKVVRVTEPEPWETLRPKKKRSGSS